MRIACALFTSALVISSCTFHREADLEAKGPKKQAASTRQSEDEELKQFSLSPSQAKETLKFRKMAVAGAEFGYHTNSPDVVVAELCEGSGIAMTTWVVLRRREGESWRAVGEPSETVFEPVDKVRIAETAEGEFFEAVLRSGKGIRLHLPNYTVPQ